MSLSGKVALVTGATSGIGKATVTALLQEGIRVCFTDVRENLGIEPLAELQKTFGAENVTFRVLDVTIYDQFEDVMKATKDHFGRLDILHNNAGIADEADWKRMVDINLVGVIYGMKLAETYLGCPEEKGGIIINTASILGLRTCYSLPVYSASKFGVVGLTLAMGHKHYVKKNNIRVAAVCPDLTETPLLTNFDGNAELQALGRKVATMKILKPQQIGDAVVKLIKDNVSAQFLVVSRTKGPYYFPIPKDDVLMEDGLI